MHGAVWPLCRGGRRDPISFPEFFMKNRRPQIFHISKGAGYFSCHSSVVSVGPLCEMCLTMEHNSAFLNETQISGCFDVCLHSDEQGAFVLPCFLS